MKGSSNSSAGSASVAPIKIVYHGPDLSEEVRSIPTADLATRLMLQGLSDDLISMEGLYDDLTEEAEVNEELVFIPWDDPFGE